MSIEELFKNVGVEITGLTTTPGRGRNSVNEYTFLIRGDDADRVGEAVRAALAGNPLRLIATVLVKDGLFECTVLSVPEKP